MCISAKKYLRNLDDFLFLCFIALIPFQDTFLVRTSLGFLGYYLSLIPLVLLIMLRIFNLGNITVSKQLVVAMMYMIVVSCMMVLTQIHVGYTSFLLYKIFTNFVTFLLWLIAISVTSKKDVLILRKGLIIAFLINCFSIVISDYFQINDGLIIHANDIEYPRLRGFTSESSWFGYTTVLLGGMLSLLLNSRPLKFLVISTTLCIVLISGSKGTILCVGLVFVIWLYQKLYNKIVKLSFFVIVTFVGAVYFPLLFDVLFSKDIEIYSSFATRASSIISAFDILLHYPFGTGFGAFIPIYRESLMNCFYFLQDVSGLQLNSYEIEYMVMGDIYAKGATVKSIIFQWVAFFGVPMIFVFYKLIYRSIVITKNIKEFRYLLLFFILANLTYSSFMFESCVFIGLLTKMRDKYNMIYKKDIIQI